jgi:hypothetical protein
MFHSQARLPSRHVTCEVIKSRRLAKCVRYLTLQMEDLWQEDAKRNTRLSKSGKPVNIEKGYEKRGVGSKEAERRAWATVNKLDRGDRKKVEEVAEKSEVNQVPTKWKKRWSKVEPPKAQAIELGTKPLRNVIRSLGNGQVNFILIWPVLSCSLGSLFTESRARPSRKTRYEPSYISAATLSCARCFLRGSRAGTCRALLRHSLRVFRQRSP